MMRFKLRELMADRQFKSGYVVTIQKIADETGIHRATLSKILNERGYNTGTENLDALCGYFGCRVEDLVEVVPDPSESRRKARGR